MNYLRQICYGSKTSITRGGNQNCSFELLATLPFGYEIADLDIAVGDDVAFTHRLSRSSATLPTGQKIGNWLRWTACFRKIGGTWLMVHEHISVPVDVETGRAVLDLKP